MVPGGTASCAVRIRNTGDVVDSYTVSVVGDAARWATAMPAVLSLFPGGEGEVTVAFQPPRSPDLLARAIDFGVRVQAAEDPEGSFVEEGVVTVEPFVEITARLTPRTSEAKRKAKHVVAVENNGNAPVRVELSASDPDELLAFGIKPSSLTIDPGRTEHADVRVAARQGFLRGGDRHRPFQTVVSPTVGAPPQVLEGTLVQRAGLPRFVPALVAAVVVIALAALLLPGLTKRDSGTFSLSSADSASTTTTVAAAGEGAEEGEGEESVEAASTDGEGGEGAGAPAASGASGASASSGGSTARPTDTGATPAGGGVATTLPPEPDAPATPEEKPVAAATTVKPTTTTVPPPFRKFVGTWNNTNASTGFEPTMTIRGDGTNLVIHGYGACSPDYCDWGEYSTPKTDADDGALHVRINQSNGYILQTLTYRRDGKLSVHSDKYNPDGTPWYSQDEVFNKA